MTQHVTYPCSGPARQFAKCASRCLSRRFAFIEPLRTNSSAAGSTPCHQWVGIALFGPSKVKSVGMEFGLVADFDDQGFAPLSFGVAYADTFTDLQLRNEFKVWVVGE